MPLSWRRWFCLAILVQTQSIAGEIPGLPASMPPYIERSLELSLSNDFLGRGGSSDDFRTQQIILTAKPTPRWTLLLDHSVLTLRDPVNPGRIDQLSGTLGYDLLRRSESDRNGRLSVGIGFRSTGEFAGERIQNGFHRLIDSQIRVLPYTGTERTDVTAWFDTEYYAVMREPREGAMFGDWRFGSWLRASSLVTSDGQLDSSASLFAVANRRAIDLWFGLRRDWRNGYSDPVVRETAAEEDDLAIALGLRIGPVVFETVQQFNNNSSYGQLRLVSSGEKRNSSSIQPPGLGIEVGLLLPDVLLHLAGRAHTTLFTAGASPWRESAFVSINIGEPQHPDNNLVFVRSAQLGIGLEWERVISERSNWLSTYGSIGAGWRYEKLIGDGALTGEKSPSIDRAVLLLGTGLRFDAAMLGARWNYRIQLGLSGWIPASDATVQIGAMTLPVQEPAINASLGMTFDFN